MGGVTRITLVDHDPSWTDRFQHEAARIRAALRERVRLLEHVGSTSVPGLAAKPCVDVLLAVDDASDERAYLPALEAGGYRLVVREPAWYQHRMLRARDGVVNLHVLPHGCPEIERMLRFRDRLRAVPEERARYEAVKRELVLRPWATVDEYAQAKTAVIEAILARGAT